MKESPNPAAENSSRRKFLKAGAMLGGALAACSSPDGGPAPQQSRLGRPVSAYGERSRFEVSRRHLPTTQTPEAASTRTPLQDSEGIITPSALHFERHHAGVPELDPAEHRLLIHGLVDRAMIFTVAEIRRLASVSRIHFIECSGNGRAEWGAKTAPDAQRSHGLASCSEWTGVPLKLLLAEAGVKPKAKWLIAEGADACKMQRSLPIEKAMDDVILAWGQNGEALRPEQGYPLRLVVPGWEGNINVKWLRRIKAADQAYMARDETSKYTDLMANGKARQFTFVMEAKSVITTPSGGAKIEGQGAYEIRGLAWSGRGRIERVEVSTDGGASWLEAELSEPRLPRAFTRFRLPWRWEGQETVLQSRCTDETGYVQPTTEELIAARGRSSDYHHNGVKSWRVSAGGEVTNVEG